MTPLVLREHRARHGSDCTGPSAPLQGCVDVPAGCIPPRPANLSTFASARLLLAGFGMKSFYITTAIDYVNGSPHLGHAYEKVLTDVIARFRRQMGDKVHFLTGTDEHGQKVQSSARKQ